MSKDLVKKPVEHLKNIINSQTVQEQFKNALGKHSDLFVASLIDIFNSGLQECDPGGVIQEALKAAVLKLPISKGLGFAYLVPYNKSYRVGGVWKKQKIATFQIGYKGMIQLAMRSGQVKNINTGVIYEGEWQSTDKIRGTYDFTGKKESEKVVGYFCYLELINGFEKLIYWTKEQVIAHAQAKSKSYGNEKSTWATDFDAMAKKTVVRALFSKYAPMSIDFVAVINTAEEADSTEPKNIDLDVDNLGAAPKKLADKTKTGNDENPINEQSHEADFGEN